MNAVILAMICIVFSTKTLAFVTRRNLVKRCLQMQTLDRIKAGSLSLDTNLITQNPDMVVSHLKSRKSYGPAIDSLSNIISLRSIRNSLIVKRDQAKSTNKILSQQIGKMMKLKEDEAKVLELKKQVEEANKSSDESDAKLAEVDKEINDLFSLIPNLLDDRVPDGNDDTDNPVIFSWGEEKRKIGTFLWHDDIANSLNGMNVDAAARISGARFSVLIGPVARLERALTQYFLDFHSDRGYKEVSVPYIVSRSTLEGTGQLPKFEDDLFKVSHQVAGEDAFLIPTAEVPVTNLYRDQVLDATDLPIKHVCLSPSFRAEAGSYGRDTRGLLRQHQFHKVELVKICAPENSIQEHEEMTNDAEALLVSLELPYRKVLLCSGDIGFSARICYDLEVWLPGQQAYREISSCSNCYDFQAKRMSLRYRRVSADPDKKGKKEIVAPHTINGSGVAVGRALVAVLENYQQPDGSVLIPEKLRPYMGGLEVLRKA